MHELDPVHLGYLGSEEVSALLAALLAAEWGGSIPDEARHRAALRRHLEAQGDRPGGAAAPSGPAAPGEPPDGGTHRLARAIREALPRIHDDALRRDLEEVLAALERGVPPGEALPSER
jgi:hypothetical protein